MVKGLRPRFLWCSRYALTSSVSTLLTARPQPDPLLPFLELYQSSN